MTNDNLQLKKRNTLLNMLYSQSEKKSVVQKFSKHVCRKSLKLSRKNLLRMKPNLELLTSEVVKPTNKSEKLWRNVDLT
jgi:hypothetical protein